MAKINIDHSKNEDKMRLAVAAMKNKLNKIHEGGGLKKIEKQHKRGKMTARERVDYLVDNN